MKGITKIQAAKLIIESEGKEAAIKHFQDRLDKENEKETKDFSWICETSALKTVIEFIKKYDDSCG